MSRLEELIQELCPDGVEIKRLDEVFEMFSGMTGASNKWAEDGNCQFIDYMNAYKNLKIDVTALKFATVKKLNQNTLKKGDVLFTSASETPDECAIASEIEDQIKDGVFMDDHLFGLRVKEPFRSQIAQGFLKYAFKASAFRSQVLKVVRGATRHYISKTDFMKLFIPVPPLPVQEEIVRILDNFTELTTELTTELEARKKQYEQYQDKLLSFDDGVSVFELGDVCVVQSGGTPSKKCPEYWKDGTIKWLGSTVCKDKKTIDEVTNFISEEGFNNSSAKLMKKDTTLIALVGATIGKVAFLPFEATINQNIAGIYPRDTAQINPSYVYYICKTLYPQFAGLTQGSKLAMANMSFVRGLKIPVPPLAEQERIVAVLDRFDALCNDLSSGLPAEIEARKKQYEYYRDKLLTFKELGA